MKWYPNGTHVGNIIKGYSVSELFKMYNLTTYKLKRLSVRAHVAIRPAFRFLIYVGSHKEYFVTRYQLFKSCKYRYGIRTSITRVAKKLLEKQGVKLTTDYYKWFYIKSDNIYCPDGRRLGRLKNGKIY